MVQAADLRRDTASEGRSLMIGHRVRNLYGEAEPEEAVDQCRDGAWDWRRPRGYPPDACPTCQVGWGSLRDKGRTYEGGRESSLRKPQDHSRLIADARKRMCRVNRY